MPHSSCLASGSYTMQASACRGASGLFTGTVRGGAPQPGRQSAAPVPAATSIQCSNRSCLRHGYWRNSTSRPTDQCFFSRPSQASSPAPAKPPTSVRPRTTSSFRWPPTLSSPYSAAHPEWRRHLRCPDEGDPRRSTDPVFLRPPFSAAGTSLRPGQPNRTPGSLRQDGRRGGRVRGSPSVRKPIPWSSCQ